MFAAARFLRPFLEYLPRELDENSQKRNCWHQFALDDFGSGMSSLAYLRNLPVDYLKIDRNFVKNLNKDPVNRAIIDSFNNIARAVAIETIAEGVENELVLEELRVLGVNYAQGYGIDRPSPLLFFESKE